MESPEQKELREQDEIRKHLNEVLLLLRQRQTEAGQSPKGRAISIAVTELEKTSMVVIRSFFADEPYSPLQKLKPANE